MLFFQKRSTRKAQKEEQNKDEETMVGCCRCKTFISFKEAIKKGECYFCSIECFKKEDA